MQESKLMNFHRSGRCRGVLMLVASVVVLVAAGARAALPPINVIRAAIGIAWLAPSGAGGGPGGGEASTTRKTLQQKYAVPPPPPPPPAP